MSNLAKRGNSYVRSIRMNRVAVRLPNNPGNYDYIDGARLTIRDTTTMTARGGLTHQTTRTHAALRGLWHLSGTRLERSGVRLRIAG